MINVQSLYDEVGGKPFWSEWTWTNSWWQLSLCSFVPASIFTFLILIFFIIDFFTKLSLLFYPWKRISLPFIMLPKCQRLNKPDARVGCYRQSNFFRSNNNHKFLHKSLSKFSLRISTKRQLQISTTSKYWPNSSFNIDWSSTSKSWPNIVLKVWTKI